jgi:hypothetical protein
MLHERDLGYGEKDRMVYERQMTPAKRKRLLKTFGPCPAGYTNDDLEHFLDLLYGLYSDLYTPENTAFRNNELVKG